MDLLYGHIIEVVEKSFQKYPELLKWFTKFKGKMQLYQRLRSVIENGIVSRMDLDSFLRVNMFRDHS